MGDKLLDPVEVNKDPQLIRDAQSEIGKLDVLVCGECHNVFHYIEQFQEHKLLGKCPRTSTVSEPCLNEQKPQVWAFMLWKNAKFKNSQRTDGSPSSWSVYQLWCNLENNQKEAWVAAGRSIQSFTKLSTAKVQEVKTKIQPIQAKATPSNASKLQHSQPKVIPAVPELSKEEEEAEDDPLEEGEIRFSQLSEAQKKAIKAHGEPASVTMKSDIDPLADSDSELDTEEEVEREAAIAKMRQEKKEKQKTLMKKSIVKPVQLNSDVTILPSMKKNGTSKKALRTVQEDKKEEYGVEKIISRRYNPGKKTFEYLLKWENCDDNQNSWEPATHLDSCKQLLEQFELNLKKQKAQKVSQAQKGDLPKPAERDRQSSVDSSKDVSRPQRTSKQKALNQVKAWCGNISDNEEGSGKRPLSDSDSDSFDKIKMEPESDSEEEVRSPIKRMRTSALNGVGRKQPLPENILVPDSQGIVRINQKQLPALSSGVYVMSKTAGIIKLDSNTSKIATSGGHAVIKVAPKIGQTSIKVIKKESITNGSKLGGKGKPIGKTFSPNIIKKATPVKKQEPPPPPPKIVEDEDSDGLEELEFPTDLPLPSPDSPPGEFTLCPLTGKVAGVEYPVEEEVKIEETPTETGDTSIDTIVKMAAAEIIPDKEGSEVTQDTEESKGSLKSEGMDVDTEQGSDNSQDQLSSIIGQETSQEMSVQEGGEEIGQEVGAQELGSQGIGTQGIGTQRIDNQNRGSQDTSGSSILSTALTNADIEEGAEPVILNPTTTRVTAGIKGSAGIRGTPVVRTVVTPRAGVGNVGARLSSGRGSSPGSGLGIVQRKQIVHTPISKQKSEMTRNIINRTITPKPAPQAIITRITPGPVNRNRPFVQKQITTPVSMQSHQVRKPIRQSYTNRNAIRKIGSTSVYQTVVDSETGKQILKSPLKSSVTTVSSGMTTVVSSGVATGASSGLSSDVSSAVSTSLSPGVSSCLSPALSPGISTGLSSGVSAGLSPTVSAVVSSSLSPAGSPTGVQATNAVINMPLLSDPDPEPEAEPMEEAQEEVMPGEVGELNTISLNENEPPLLITGEDGTIYQVAGQNEEGQTILITQDADGQQQCLLVASENAAELTQAVAASTGVEATSTDEQLVINTGQEEIETEEGNSEDSQVVAQIVSAQPPSPGGTRKVVLMLPDGNLMMTEVTAEQYAALELDK